MLQNMMDAIDNGVFEDDVYLSLVSFVVDGNSISLTFELTYRDDENALQKWEIRCKDFGEHKLELFIQTVCQAKCDTSSMKLSW